MGALLIAVGVVLLLFVFLAAFTVYGEIAGVLGSICIGAGIFVLARRNSRRAAGP